MAYFLLIFLGAATAGLLCAYLACLTLMVGAYLTEVARNRQNEGEGFTAYILSEALPLLIVAIMFTLLLAQATMQVLS